MDEVISQHTRLASEVEQLCGKLFERWCDRRSVIPLAYLLHHWPIVSPSQRSFRRLSYSLRQLADSELDSLDVDDRRMIENIIWNANNMGKFARSTDLSEIAGEVACACVMCGDVQRLTMSRR